MSNLPDVHFGEVGREPMDWRKQKELVYRDDDAELTKTPRDVVEILGFDPLDEVE